MAIRNIITLGICLTLISFRQPFNKPEKDNSVDQAISIADTSNQYIYDFMKVVIADQQLDLSYGLTVEPEQGCTLSQNDKIFLKTLLTEKTKPKKDTGDWWNINITINQLPKCLTIGDIDEMLFQKEKLSHFTWDNSRLGFSTSNDKNWYCFSRPLFSKDRKIVVMMIRNLCPGLFGTGWTVVFTMQNNKWTSQTGSQWIH